MTPNQRRIYRSLVEVAAVIFIVWAFGWKAGVSAFLMLWANNVSSGQ